jgi:hypothetical protein
MDLMQAEVDVAGKSTVTIMGLGETAQGLVDQKWRSVHERGPEQ